MFRDYNKAVMDIAEKTGLIDGAARHLWEHDFYVPYYRVMEDEKIGGPAKIKGLVRQQAFKKLKGGQESLGDLMANTLRNWNHFPAGTASTDSAHRNTARTRRTCALTCSRVHPFPTIASRTRVSASGPNSAAGVSPAVFTSTPTAAR